MGIHKASCALKSNHNTSCVGLIQQHALLMLSVQGHNTCDTGLQLSVLPGKPHQSLSFFSYPSSSTAGTQTAISVQLLDIWGNAATYVETDLRVFVKTGDANGSLQLTRMVNETSFNHKSCEATSTIYLETVGWISNCSAWPCSLLDISHLSN